MVEQSSLSDEKVIEASLSDPNLFAEVFERRSTEIYRYLSHHVGSQAAEELMSDTFSQAFRARSTYEPSRGSVRGWLYGIAANAIRHKRRSDIRRTGAYSRLAERGPTGSHLDELDQSAASRLDDQLQLRRALGRLSPKLRQVVLLIGGSGLSYEEAASALHLPIGTVRSRYSRGRQQLQQSLGINEDLDREESETR